jgi:hypothetical protein
MVVLLDCLSGSLTTFRDADDQGVRDRVADCLSAKLVDLYLSTENVELQKSAIQLLNKFTGSINGHLLLENANSALFKALFEGTDSIRLRALKGVQFSTLKNHIEIAWGLLYDKNLRIVLQALHFFRVAKSEVLHFAVLRVLRRIAKLNSGFRNEVVKRAAQASDSQNPKKLHRRCLALLQIAATRGQPEEIQYYCVIALKQLNSPSSVPVLIEILHSDVWEHTRAMALLTLIAKLKDDADSYILNALSDRSPEVRITAVMACWKDKTNENFRINAGPKLFCLVNDSSEMVSRYAKHVLSDWNYIKKNWWMEPHQQAEPIYLGPKTNL